MDPRWGSEIPLFLITSPSKPHQQLYEISDPLPDLYEIPDPPRLIGGKRRIVLPFFLPCLHLLLETFISPPWHFCLSRMTLNQTLTAPWRLGWGEDGEGKVQCEQKQSSFLEKKAPSAFKNAEAENTDNEQ